MVENLPVMWDTWVRSLSWEDPLRRGRLPTPVFLPGEFHGQRRLSGYTSWGHKELDMTEWQTHIHTYTKQVVCVCVFLVTQSCPNLSNPMDCSPSGSSVQGIFQAIILEWVAISSSRSFHPEIKPEAPALQVDSLPLSHWGAPKQALDSIYSL